MPYILTYARAGACVVGIYDAQDADVVVSRIQRLFHKLLFKTGNLNVAAQTHEMSFS